MNWQILQKIRLRRAAEQGAVPPGTGGKLSVCLVYPQNYRVAMSNLGFQSVYKLFNLQPGVVCERAFLPERDELSIYEKAGDTLISFENERPLSDFDVVAFSISFEADFINVPKILRLARIPELSRDRNDSTPLVIAGGSVFLINPEPVAEFFEFIAVGEGEAIIPELASALVQDIGNRGLMLSKAVTVPGIYYPADAEGQIVKRQIAPTGTPASQSVIMTEETEFGRMFMVEICRGCPRGCRFCAAGFVHQPFRIQPFEYLKEVVLEGLKYRKTIGIVGTAVSDYSKIEELCRFIIQNGGIPSLSSLRVDRLTPSLLDLLAQAGHRTISLAPEGGSQRMRDMIRKNLTEKQILDATEAVARSGILNLRLYFIIGLPGETDKDLDEMVRLTNEIRRVVVEHARAHKRLGEITLSVNPFIPKPSTPLQWAGMCPIDELRYKVNRLQKQVQPLSNVRLKVEDLTGCLLQALLSRGGRELTGMILLMSNGLNLKKAAKKCNIDLDASVTASLLPGDRLPWQKIDLFDQKRLESEYLEAIQSAGVTP